VGSFRSRWSLTQGRVWFAGMLGCIRAAVNYR